MSLVTDDEVERDGLQHVGRPDEHLVAHYQDRVTRVLGVVANLVVLERDKSDD